MSAVNVLTAVALAVLGIGFAACAWYAYLLLSAWAEQREMDRKHAEAWRASRAARRQAGE